MSKIANGGFWGTAIEEMQYLMKKPPAEVQEEKKWGVVFAGHKTVEAAIERYPVIHHQNHMESCLSWLNGTARILQRRWRRNGEGAPPPD